MTNKIIGIGSKVTNGNKLGFVIGSHFNKDQFNQAIQIFEIQVIKELGSKKQNKKDKAVDYIINKQADYLNLCN